MSFKQDAEEVAKLVEEKQVAYGDSFGKSGEVLAVLYPNGVPVEKYRDMLTVVRVLDKLFRVATDKDALGENPWRDVMGYALLAQRKLPEQNTKSCYYFPCKEKASHRHGPKGIEVYYCPDHASPCCEPL